MAAKQCEMMGWPATSKRGYIALARTEIYPLACPIDSYLGKVERKRTEAGSS
jgi:hypothetical protein